MILDDTIGKVTKAIEDELHDRLKKISNQIQAVYKNVDDNSLLMGKLQKKFQARSLSLESTIEKINQFMKEERHYEISGVTKKNATLKGQIIFAIEEFETLMSSFITNQAIHCKNHLDSISRLLDLMVLKFPS